MSWRDRAQPEGGGWKDRAEPEWTPEQQTEIARIRGSLAEQPRLAGVLPIKSSTPPNVSSPLGAVALGAMQGATMQQGQEALGDELGSQKSAARDVAQAKEQHPLLFHSANIAASIPSYIATSPYRALRAIQGGLEGYGGSAGQQPLDRAEATAVGALANLVIPEAVASAAGPLKRWLANRAGGLVGSAIARGGGKIAEAAKESGQLPEIGKEVLERGAAGWTAKGTQEAIQPAKKAVGGAIQDALSAVDSHGAQFNGAAAAQRIEDEVRSKLLGEETSKGVRAHVDDLISDLRRKYASSDFSSANDFKSRLFKMVSDAKWALKEGTPAQKALMKSMGILSDEISEQAGKVSPEAAAALSEANQSYGRLADAGSMAARTANKKLSLGEMLLHGLSAGGGAAGFAQYPKLTTAAVGLVQAINAARKYGGLPAAKLLYGASRLAPEVAPGLAGAMVPEAVENAPVMLSRGANPLRTLRSPTLEQQRALAMGQQ